MVRNRAITLFITILLFAGFSYAIYSYNRNKDSNNIADEIVNSTTYLSISINPEVGLSINEEGIVAEVIPINEEADIIMSDLSLVGMAVEEASLKIADAAIETGFIDEYSDDNTIVITTTGDDDEQVANIQDKVMNKLNNHFESRKIYPVLVAKGLNDELKEEASEYEISNGKMLLVDYAVALNPNLSKDTLTSYNIKDIQKEIRAYVETRHDALKENLEDAKIKWQKEKQNLKEVYSKKVDALRTIITEEQKDVFSNMTAAEKEELIKKSLDSRKETIKNAVGKVKDDLKENMTDFNYPILKNNVDTIKETIKDRIQESRNRKE